jgi:RsiW-degrading membrane proteinase PrsW (M82 family)
MRCEKCGFDFDQGLDRCPKCGASVEFAGNTHFYLKAKEEHAGFFDTVFSGVFRKHPSGTAAKIFAAGTPETTPAPDKMFSAWQKPWLYSRFLIAGLVFLLVGWFLAFSLNPGILGVVCSFGALVMPFTILMFIWEMNIPRNISFIKLVVYFFVGGMISMIFTLIFGAAFEELDPPFAAFIEEPAKLLTTLIIMHKAKTKYGFGGMLIGAAVGAGFTVFENIAYIFNFFLAYGLEMGKYVFISRSLTAIGTHTVWAAIAGAAAALGRKGKSKGFGYLAYPLFWICFVADIAMHFVWNGGLSLLVVLDDNSGVNDLLQDLLCVVAVVLLFFITNKCLKQVIYVYDSTRMEMMNRKAYAQAQVQPDSQQNQYADAQPSAQQNVQVSNNNAFYAANQVAAYVPQQAVPKVFTVKSDYLKLEVPVDRVLCIGRDPNYCDIVFPADTAGVSRKHCALSVSPEGYIYVMDLGSSMGTFLPDGRKLNPNEWTAIDDTFFVASEAYTFTVQ